MTVSVRLRPAVDSDSDILFEWINDPELVMFNAPFREIGRVEHDAWFARIRAQEEVVFFMIDSLETGLSIGSCQLLNIHPIHRSAELQIRIGSKENQNRGAGSDSVRQLVNYGFSNLNLHRIALHVFATNHRAIRVYEKNQFVSEGLLRQAALIDGQWRDVVCMARLRESCA